MFLAQHVCWTLNYDMLIFFLYFLSFYRQDKSLDQLREGFIRISIIKVVDNNSVA